MKEEIKNGEQYPLLKDERKSEDEAHDIANMMQSVLKEVGFKDNEITAHEYTKAEMVVEDIIENAKNESDFGKFEKYIATVVAGLTFGVLESAILIAIAIKQDFSYRLGHTTDEVCRKNMQAAVDSFKGLFESMATDEGKLKKLKQYGKWIDKDLTFNKNVFNHKS